ncbi:androgen-dependent TFPI-regulating protein-like [Aricia agestis]|uniref:androgen-dependent TFPI-regulating protein-like n=1 Tax=Aricia agestis TaxID=91739 RepID=UPI001C208CB0|nr:androgen-dependent TFPI-regulating protein-like [Aricia agestis]
MSDKRSRLLSNGVFLAGHCVNVVCTLYTLREGQNSLKDKRVVEMKQQMFKFLTIWNVIFHMIYLVVNIICEAQELFEIKDKGILSPFKAAKQVFFDSILVPTTMSISLVFWPMFLYDRELLYPAFIDDAIGAIANYMMHAFIVLVAVWEMRYMSPKEKYRGLCLINVGLLSGIYIAVLLHNHAETGLFPYPLLYMLHGTMYLNLLWVSCIVLIYAVYHAQWPLRRLVSIQHEKKRRSNKAK